MKEKMQTKKNYNFIAEEYHNLRTKKYPPGWFYNEMTEMPAVLELLGNVKRKKILDLGCGTGIYAKLLTKKGAIVKGFDLSPGMINIAKRENPRLDLRVGSANKIPFNEKFDIVLASLIVHYISNWNKMLNEVKRVLKKGGLFIFSTGNPITECVDRKDINGERYHLFGDYYTERKIRNNWNVKGKNIKMVSYHITYETLIDRVLSHGFEIVGYKDCKPLRLSKKYFPEEYKSYWKRPSFCAWKLKLK